MAVPLDRSVVFIALTRPQMFAGVTWSWFVANLILSAELFLIFKSPYVLAAALVIHLIGLVLCLREPRIIDIWIARVGHCRRVPNYRRWGCNSYSA
jgi:type IV secretion system protein VirB3